MPFFQDSLLKGSRFWSHWQTVTRHQLECLTLWQPVLRIAAAAKYLLCVSPQIWKCFICIAGWPQNRFCQLLAAEEYLPLPVQTLSEFFSIMFFIIELIRKFLKNQRKQHETKAGWSGSAWVSGSGLLSWESLSGPRMPIDGTGKAGVSFYYEVSPAFGKTHLILNTSDTPSPPDILSFSLHRLSKKKKGGGGTQKNTQKSHNIWTLMFFPNIKSCFIPSSINW